MAATSASRNWAAFARRAVTAGAVAAVGLMALAIPAGAHVPDAKAGCDKETSKPQVSVSFLKYRTEDGKPDGMPNSVTVVEVKDGKKTMLKEVSFGKELVDTFVFDKLDGRVEHTFEVKVNAFDDQDKEHPQGWTKTFRDLKSEVCDTSTPPSSESSTPSSPSSQTPPPATTTTEAPVVGANANLASTGVSIAVPLAVGALLLVGGGVLLVLMRRRGRA